MIPFQTARAIGIMPSIIDHCVLFPSVCSSAVEFCRRVGGKKNNLTTPLRPLSSAPVLFSSCRASPVSYIFKAIRCTDDPPLHTALQLLAGI